MKEALNKFLLDFQEVEDSNSVAAQLLSCISVGEFELKVLAETISRDVRLSASILGLANSPHYRRSEEITSLNYAVSLIGVWTLRSIAALFLVKEIGDLSTGDWNHGMRVAVAAQMQAEYYGEDPALAFCTGLIHDIGAILLANFDPQGYGAIESILLEGLTMKAQTEYIESEVLRYGVSHSELGATILEYCGFPVEVTEAVRLHHQAAAWHSPVHRSLVSAERLVHLERLDPMRWGSEILLPEGVDLALAIERLGELRSREADLILGSAVLG